MGASLGTPGTRRSAYPSPKDTTQQQRPPPPPPTSYGTGPPGSAHSCAPISKRLSGGGHRQRRGRQGPCGPGGTQGLLGAPSDGSGGGWSGRPVEACAMQCPSGCPRPTWGSGSPRRSSTRPPHSPTLWGDEDLDAPPLWSPD